MNVVARLSLGIAVGSVAMGLVACPSSTETQSMGSATDGEGGGANQGGTDTATSSSSSGSGGGFVHCPEPVSNFSTGECDLLNPDCPEGKSCFPILLPDDTTTTKCTAWSGVKGLGAACSSHEECSAGLFCAYYCSPICCQTPGISNCDCSVSGGGFEHPDASVWLCNYLPKCALFTPNACKDHPGSQCHVQKPEEELATCSPPSANQKPPTEGKPCKFLNDCSTSQMCLNEELCRYNCLVDSYQTKALEEGGCPEGQMCLPLMLDSNLGVCLPP